MEISNTLGPIHYAYCECHVWPLSTLNKVGVCGFCLTKPYGFFETKEEALAAYREEYDRR
jgi:hypothetical protein